MGTQQPRRRVDPVDRAHLTGITRPSPPIHRYAPAADLTDLVLRYWIPVWSLTEPSTQSTLQHPVALLVISADYARFYGVTRGLSSVTLAGDGWAVGTMLAPGAGAHLLGGSLAPLTDRYDVLAVAPALDERLAGEVRAAMAADPCDPAAHARAIDAVEARLRAALPLDEAGLLVNRVVDWVHEHPDATRVGDLADAFDVTERTLQRLIEQRLGITPKWLLQRRRLHEAVERLKAGRISLAALAADLGYTDQAHFTHDFRTMTGMTPGEYLTDQPVSR